MDFWPLGTFLKSMIPRITKPGLFHTFRDKYALDGGFTAPITYRFKDSKKLFINILPEFIYFNIPDNCEIIHAQKVFNLVFPNDYVN